MAAKGLSDERAARFMVALRGGMTPHLFGVNTKSLELYFATHPDYALEARPLIETNAAAARRRKGSRLRKLTEMFCLKGLHAMTGSNVRIDPSRGRRCCLACRNFARDNPPQMTSQDVTKVRQALEAGASTRQILGGHPVGGGKIDRRLILTTRHKFYQQRRLDPEFNLFVATSISDHRGVGLRIHFQRKLSAAKKEEANDYYKIRAMLPASFPDKDDVVGDIFEAMLNGSLRREDVKDRVQTYIAAHNRMFPTKYARFGDSPLVSLDEVLFDDGTATRGDTVSRGLWD
jgi:hypothetical protein